MSVVQNFLRAVKRRQHIPGLVHSAGGLHRWFVSPAGAKVLEQEQRAIDKALSCLFGYHLLQLSVLPSAHLYGSSRIAHCCRVSYQPTAAELVSEFEVLPLANESVDVTLVHHALDFSENPHQLLNEVSRVTIAHGHMVIVGFDPRSLTGALKPFAQLMSAQTVWKRHSFSCGRINDWFKLLGFELVDTYAGHCRVPVARHLSKGVSRHVRMPFGHFYCLVARKSLAGARPIKPLWDAQLLRGVKKGVKIAPRPVTARGAARLSLIKNTGPKHPGDS